MKALLKNRVRLNDAILEDFFNNILTEGISELAKRTGLTYGLIYNLAFRRIKSLSKTNFRKIFGKSPAMEIPERVDGEYFREMVKLWLYLNDTITQKDLYEEFYHGKTFKKIDYRIFTGEIDTIEYRLERAMEQKFFEKGLMRNEIKDWIQEIRFGYDKERVPYENVRQILQFLTNALHVNPSRLLKKNQSLYESGKIKTISKDIFDRIMMLKAKTEKALRTNGKDEIGKLRQEIYVTKQGYTKFYEVYEELEFLKQYSGLSPKKYLGRSDSDYKNNKLKNVANWRVKKIYEDCQKLINARPDIPLLSLPRFFQQKEMWKLLHCLKKYSIKRMCDNENIESERFILEQINRYGKKQQYSMNRLVRFDDVPHFLTMKRRAFDYLVARHSNLFKKIAVRKGSTWYIPIRYLERLNQTTGFSVLRGKYEFWATTDKIYTCN